MSVADLPRKDQIVCFLYGAIALIALPATWINNIAFMRTSGDPSPLAFVRAAYANFAAASLTNDVLLVAIAAGVFMVIEGRRVGIRFIWAYVILSALIAISVTFPLFLIARQIKLAKR